MTDRFRLAVIGTGIMGERMLRAAAEHAGDIVAVSAVWDRDAAALDRVAALAPGAMRAGSAAACMAEADCVYVATPPGTHIDYADQAFAAGKAVFLEKPLATDVAAADAFVRRAQGKRAAVNFPFASSPAVGRLREWLGEGAIGAASALDIEMGFAAWPRPWQAAAGAWLDAPAEGGFLREVGSHFLFLARRVLGELTAGPARVERGASGTETMVDARLHAGGVPVHLRGRVGGVAADDENRWTLHGTGAVRLRDWSIAERQRPDGGWAADAEAIPNERMRPLVLRRQLEAVRMMVAGQAHGLATLEDALQVQATVERILSDA